MILFTVCLLGSVSTTLATGQAEGCAWQHHGCNAKMLHLVNAAHISIDIPTELVLPMVHNAPVSFNEPFFWKRDQATGVALAIPHHLIESNDVSREVGER